MKKKILVTGGAGFVGSHLCERLSKNNEVYSLDNYFTGSKGNFFIEPTEENIIKAFELEKESIR